MRYWRTLIALAGLGLLGVPAFGAEIPNGTGTANPAEPGAVNYIEGAAFLDGRPLSNQNVGAADLNAGEELTTNAGKAEILLTPGIFLRVGSNSAVKMISPDLANTQVELDRGRAAIEVDQIFPQNMVQMIDNGVATQLMKTGYYEFDANQPEAMVFKGEAEVETGNGKWEKVKGHHELALVADAREKSVDFNAHPTNDALYNWSSLRSEYLAEANNQIAPEYAYGAGFYPGWYWDPYMYGYTFLGVDPFYSPFGWGFYPWGGYYGGSGFYGHGFDGGRGFHGHPVPSRGGSEGFHGGGGFHGGTLGGGGGFHGGSFGGGGGRR
jgi:hypothetical protein